MTISAHQYGLSDLLWFLFGIGAFLLPWSAYTPLGGLTSFLLLALFYWRAQARDVLLLHCVMGTFFACAWWSVEAAVLVATHVSFAVHLLSLLARQL